jgi:hypothetical protein
MAEETKDKPYRFWLPLVMDIFKFGVGIYLTVGLFALTQELAMQDAAPQLDAIGVGIGEPNKDKLKTIRLKNLSTKQDAVVTGLEYLVSDKHVVECIKKRHPFVKNQPPAPPQENILPGKEPVYFTIGRWNEDGTIYRFHIEVDLQVPPGKSESLRVGLKGGDGAGNLWEKAWMTGMLVIEYDRKTLMLAEIMIADKSLDRAYEVPAGW